MYPKSEALGLQRALRSHSPPSSYLQRPPRDLALGACPPGQEAWNRVCPSGSAAQGDSIPNLQEAETTHLLGYLGQISTLSLAVLLPAYFWGFLCSREPLYWYRRQTEVSFRLRAILECHTTVTLQIQKGQ